MESKNIVILLIDALRVKNLSLFGYNKETDANLKLLAKDGLLFKQHFSTSNATAPALTSILTGQYPPTHGIIHQPPYTKEEEIRKVERVRFWFPTFLKKYGYDTLCIDWLGMWMKKDFDFYGEEDEENKIFNRQTPFISAQQTVNLAISQIKKTTKPFFLFTHFWDTHFPFSNINYESTFSNEDRDKMLQSIENSFQREYLKKRIEKTKNLFTISDMVNKYDAAIKEIDFQIGRFFSFLKEHGLWENTIIFVLGDHGDSLTEHGIYFSHAGLYDDSIHVPMIMRAPGLEANQINEFSQHTDILPTILDLLKIKAEDYFEGISLVPLIKHGKIPFRNKVFAFDGLCNKIMTIRTKQKKLILSEDSFCNLCKGEHHKKIEEYDLLNDPGETKNLFSSNTDSGEHFLNYI